MYLWAFLRYPVAAKDAHLLRLPNCKELRIKRNAATGALARAMGTIPPDGTSKFDTRPLIALASKLSARAYASYIEMIADLKKVQRNTATSWLFCPELHHSWTFWQTKACTATRQRNRYESSMSCVPIHHHTPTTVITC